MKATDILGYTFDGAAYCPECSGKAFTPDELKNAKPEEEAPHPIFASDEWEYIPTCDRCQEPIEDVRLTVEGQICHDMAKRTVDLRTYLRETRRIAKKLEREESQKGTA